jgi:hypothetical protein
MNYVETQKVLELMSKNLWLFLFIFIWTYVWKGIALWKSARNGHKKWFVALLILNTLAILEIVYIFAFSKKKTKK